MPDEPVSPADRAWLLEQELGPEIRRVFRRVANDRIGMRPIPASARMLYDPAFGPFHGQPRLPRLLHQRDPASGHLRTPPRPTVSRLSLGRRRPRAGTEPDGLGRVPVRHRNSRRTAHCHLLARPAPARESTRRSSRTPSGASSRRGRVRPVGRRMHRRAHRPGPTRGRIPRQAGPEAGHRVRALADRLRNSTASDYLDFAAVMIHGDNAAMAAAVEHYTGWEADYDFRGTLPDVPVRSRALHLLDQMAGHERILLTGLLRPEDRL
ncbi:hypothetical protein ACU686_34890 [Yinghuangia aomiensis]